MTVKKVKLTIYYEDKINPPENFVDQKNVEREITYKYAVKNFVAKDEHNLISVLVDIGTNGLMFPTDMRRDEYVPPHRIEKIYIEEVE